MSAALAEDSMGARQALGGLGCCAVWLLAPKTVGALLRHRTCACVYGFALALLLREHVYPEGHKGSLPSQRVCAHAVCPVLDIEPLKI